MSRETILGGFHAIGARLRHAPESIEVAYLDPSRRDARMRELRQRLEAAGVRIVAADAQRLRGLAGEVPHQGAVVLARVLEPKLDFDQLLDAITPRTLLLVLDGVTDPRNLGACLRVADAAGVQAVIVPRDRSAGLNVATLKAAAGAGESVPLISVTNLARAIEDLQAEGVRVVGAAGEAQRSLYEVDQTGAFAWVLGAEGEGMRRLTRERCDELASIPLLGAVESLNVSVAAGVCLYESVRQRRAAG